MNNIEKSRAIPQYRFPEFANSDEWDEKEINELLNYERPDNYIVSDTNYNDEGTPVLTANKSFVLGYTNETEGVYQDLPAIIFDDFTVDKKYVDFPFKVKSSAIKILKQKNKNNLKFVFELMNTIRFDPSEHKRYYISVYQNLKVAVPKKIDEQNKIANCLSSLDNCIEAEAEKLEELKIHKKGLMQKLFPIDDETVPQYRFPEFVGSADWEEITLDDLAEFRRGSFPQPYGLPEWYDEEKGMPFIQVFDVGEDLRIKPKTKNKISKFAAKKSVFIAAGTVIVTLQGSIGRVAITQYDAYIDRTLLLFEKINREIDKTFFAYILQLLFDIEKQKAPGGIIKTITKEVLSKFVVRITEINEQKKIANFLISLDNLINSQAEKVEALKLHKKGFMQGLFPTNEEENK